MMADDSTPNPVVEFGPFKVVTVDIGSNDFALTDQAESSFVGFQLEEIGDLAIVSERLLAHREQQQAESERAEDSSE